MFEAYRTAIGRHYHEIATPALLLHHEVVCSNIATMANRLRGLAGIRPHAKSHKSVEIARLQLGTGAIGMTTATVWEAAALAGSGVSDLLIANEVVGETKIQSLTRSARTASVTVVLSAAEFPRPRCPSQLLPTNQRESGSPDACRNRMAIGRASRIVVA